MADVVEQGFEVLLSPTGDQVKVLVDARRGRVDEGAAVRRARAAPRSPSCRCPRSPTTRCWSRRARSASATPTSTCSRAATSSRSPIRSSRATSGPARWSRVGPTVTDLAAGDRVVGECVIGDDHFGFSISGAAAEFFVAKPAWLHRLPDELSWTMGALVEPFSVAYYALVRAGGVDASDTVVVLGAGPDRARRHRRGRRDGRADRRRRALGRPAGGGAGSSARRTPCRPERGRGAARASSPAAAAPTSWSRPAAGPAVMARALELVAFRGRVAYIGIDVGREAPGEARADPVQGAADHRLDRLARGVAGDAAVPGAVAAST